MGVRDGTQRWRQVDFEDHRSLEQSRRLHSSQMRAIQQVHEQPTHSTLLLSLFFPPPYFSPFSSLHVSVSPSGLLAPPTHSFPHAPNLSYTNIHGCPSTFLDRPIDLLAFLRPSRFDWPSCDTSILLSSFFFIVESQPSGRLFGSSAFISLPSGPRLPVQESIESSSLCLRSALLLLLLLSLHCTFTFTLLTLTVHYPSTTILRTA